MILAAATNCEIGAGLLLDPFLDLSESVGGVLRFSLLVVEVLLLLSDRWPDVVDRCHQLLKVSLGIYTTDSTDDQGGPKNTAAETDIDI